tara:strand:+ start:40528 stop:41178 length:651 start_codon:yes stop_codon:yes gene_type:complete
MKKAIISLLCACLLCSHAFAKAPTSEKSKLHAFYIDAQGGMFAAAWRAPTIIQRFLDFPDGTPEGAVGRFSAGYQANEYLAIEAGIFVFQGASRPNDSGQNYNIEQQAYDGLVVLRTPELFWHIRLMGKFGFAHMQGELSGGPLPSETAQAWLPEFGFGYQQQLTPYLSANMGWYRITGKANIASTREIAGIIAPTQNIPNIDLFMGGINYRFNLF